MKCFSWNVAGIRARIKNGYIDFLAGGEWDIVCFQETKAEEEQVKLTEDIRKVYPYRYWKSCQGITQRKGLNGTSIWSKTEPVKEIAPPDFDVEGRITSLEFDKFIIVTVYTPNSQSLKSDRFVFRTDEWDVKFLEYIKNLDKNKPVVVCGDLNIAREDMDVFAPDRFKNKIAGFLNKERENFEKILDEGWVDTFREKYPNEPKKYTYWDQKIKARREQNDGWRIDYFLVPIRLRESIVSAEIRPDIIGSDHCPVILEINI